MIPFDKEHNQDALRILHDVGIEMTPDELAIHQKAAMKSIRKSMTGLGYVLPETDEDLFLLMVEIIRE